MTPGWRHPALSAAIACLTILSAAPAKAAAAPCNLIRDSSVDMTMSSSGRVVVPATLTGHPITLLVDTGGMMSTLTKPAADRLGFQPRKAGSDASLIGFGGYVLDEYVTATDANIGLVHIDKVDLYILPDSLEADGLLAPDILSRFDVEFDFSGGKLKLFEPNLCASDLAYWAPEDKAAEIPITLDSARHIVVTVEIDGRPTKAILDTGAADTVMSVRKAALFFRFNVADLPVVDTEGGPKAYRYPFKTLTFGGVTVNNPKITLFWDKDAAVLDEDEPMIVGMNILRQLHLYIAYRRHAIFVTPAVAAH